jgi:hypothetical protein
MCILLPLVNRWVLMETKLLGLKESENTENLKLGKVAPFYKDSKEFQLSTFAPSNTFTELLFNMFKNVSEGVPYILGLVLSAVIFPQPYSIIDLIEKSICGQIIVCRLFWKISFITFFLGFFFASSSFVCCS